MSKKTAKLTEICKRRSDRFQLCPLWSPRLYCYRFLSSLNMNQVPAKLSCQWSYIKNYSVMAIWLLK